MTNQHKIAGRIADVFAHRFVVERPDGTRLLADLGPKGADAFALRVGDVVTLEGEMKPSELKVSSIATKGEAPVSIEHKTKDHRDEHADPERAVEAVASAGFEPIGAPRRKPKHFEVLARKDGAFMECHVEFDGSIRKEKRVATTDEKWSSDIDAAA